MAFGPRSVKREQKTALFMREISSLIQQLSLDEPKLMKVFVTKVKLSNDYKICCVYLSTYTDNKEDFDVALEVLKLYRPSMRNAIAKDIGGRYTTDLHFMYDENKDKERHILDLLDKVKEEE